MGQTGQLVQWNDERGFGFIEDADGQRHFVHISVIERIATRPRIGDVVSFVPGWGQDGRPQARTVKILGANPVATRVRREPGVARAARGVDWRLLVAGLLLALLLAGAVLGRLPNPVLWAYAAMSVVSLAAYRSDKKFAETQQWRISEATLLGIDFCLGIVGGLIGQALLRHKTRKPSYVATTILIVVIHCLWLGAIALGLINVYVLQHHLAGLALAGG